MLNRPYRQHDESADDELHIEAEWELRFEPAQVDERQLPSVQDVIRRDEDRKEVARPQARTDSKYRAVRDPVAPNGHWRNYIHVPDPGGCPIDRGPAVFVWLHCRHFGVGKRGYQPDRGRVHPTERSEVPG